MRSTQAQWPIEPIAPIQAVVDRARAFQVAADRVRFDRARVVLHRDELVLEVGVDGEIGDGIAIALAQAAFASGLPIAIAYGHPVFPKRVIGERLWQPQWGGVL